MKTSWMGSVAGLALALIMVVDARPAAAQATLRPARTCIAKIQTDIGAVKVLRKLGPHQTCPAGEEFYGWERTGGGVTVLIGGTGRDINISEGVLYGAPGTVSCTMSGSVGFSCSDLTNVAPVNAGDQLAVRMEQTGGGSFARLKYSIELAP